MRAKPYATAREFRVSANAHMKKIATSSGRPTQEVNREFVLQRFLARVFQLPDAPWVLKGGTGLLVRLPRARYSDDIDLLYPTEDIDLRVPVNEIRAVMARPCGSDYFRFELRKVDEHTREGAEKAVAKIHVVASIGTTEYQRFSIDVSVKKRPVGQVDWVRPTPIVELPGIPELPEFALYPLADQIADKVCAMYETHRDGTPSTRYHDLVDLVLIVTSSTGLDAARTTCALQAEATNRDLALPTKLVSPGGQWPAGYHKEAGLAGLSADLRDLAPALDVAGACLDPLLGGELADGIWDATERRWQ
ncbi:nucleotidyl transferase AbiEii/AbiGii toxin family protein [Kribbella ginsengisoli]|uniref:Nucleotidyl transferase AbiEii/AbiGii toxin family protein n=1 Tax=Kribbella ginsengisoli TaxID=363865 RepID=A0ABP6X088_9ACTN